MKILVVSATEHEIAPYRIKHPDTEILITGVGVPATIFHLTKTLLQTTYDLVLQCGIAGTTEDDIRSGQVVLVKEDKFGDIGIESEGDFEDLFIYGLAQPDEFPFNNGWLVNDNPYFNNYPGRKIYGITVNMITDDPKRIEQIREFSVAHVQSMEGAAFHYVCLQLNVPFLQVRGISNKVGERDKAKWEMEMAIQNSNIELDKLIEHFKS